MKKIFERWKHTALHNQVLLVTAILVALGTLFYAFAAVVQIRIMERSAEAEQRAWVTVQNLTFPRTMDELIRLGTVPQITLLVANSGRTPATDATVAGHVIVRQKLSAEDLADKLQGQPRSMAIIAPGTAPLSIPLDSDQAVTSKTQVEGINSGITRVYAIGVIFYRDIFRREHKTRFCFSIGVRDYGNGMAACLEHNSVE